MKLYAEVPPKRRRQVVADLLATVAVLFSVRVGTWLHGLVSRLAAPGRALEDGGQAIAAAMEGAAQGVGQVPVAGRALRSPFAHAASAGHSLADAGQAQQDAVVSLAFWLGVLVAAGGVLVVVVGYLARRLRWIREASAAAALRDTSADLRVFAYRAVARRPLRLLTQAVADPGAALARHDYLALAQLELATLGLRRPD
ncbi:MAG TPA: hypothetical protein VG452_07025 [Egibacteraceae bacterium]|nr:hypothetical protein [Actinomycetota bacterium]HWB71952.1 hypothetical protein [Egibacteraceae bacterium]